MTQENTKLCDFSNTINNDFISTPITPSTSAESYEINAGLPSEDAASHLNTSVELCDMQKKKKMWIMVLLKQKLFSFSLRDRAKTWFSSLAKNSIDSWNKRKRCFYFQVFSFH